MTRNFYANRKREKDELMPWAMISSGVTEQYLWREHERCYQSVTTPDCPHTLQRLRRESLIGEALRWLS